MFAVRSVLINFLGSRYWLFCLLGLFLPLTAQSQVVTDLNCGTLDNGLVGPWDYQDPRSHQPTGAHPMGAIKRVTNVHFTAPMMRLERGNTAAPVILDLDYTLRAIPNHPQALWTVSRLERKHGGQIMNGGKPWSRPAICYFDRAIRFRPQDSVVRQIFGTHLHLEGEMEKALEQYKLSEKFSEAPSSELYYNMGLLYFDMGNYSESINYARKAYSMGYPLPGLKEKLVSVGRWQ